MMECCVDQGAETYLESIVSYHFFKLAPTLNPISARDPPMRESMAKNIMNYGDNCQLKLSIHLVALCWADSIVIEWVRNLHRPLRAWRYRRRMAHPVWPGNPLPMTRKVSSALVKAKVVRGRTKSIVD